LNGIAPKIALAPFLFGAQRWGLLARQSYCCNPNQANASITRDNPRSVSANVQRQ
jgi:hypothetical protein